MDTVLVSKKGEAKQMNGNETHESLLEVGFTSKQIERLSEFRKDYVEKERQEALVVQRRLEFLRWLVATGRLGDA